MQCGRNSGLRACVYMDVRVHGSWTHLVLHSLAQPAPCHGGELPWHGQDHKLARPQDADVHNGWLPACALNHGSDI